jgi:rubrerythrin
MSTSLDLSKLSLMDALDLAKLIEMEACHRYQMFASQLGRTGGYDAGSFFASMAENDYDVEAPEMGAPRRGMSVVQAFELGLEAEKKAYEFYDMALPGITNEEVRDLFTELRDEETEHVEMLKAAMAKLPESASQEVEFDLDETPYL